MGTGNYTYNGTRMRLLSLILNELIYVNCLKHSLAHDKHSVRINYCYYITYQQQP